MYLSWQELSLCLLTCTSIKDPAYLKEMHEVAALLFSLLPTLNCKPTSLTFDFYLKIRKVSCAMYVAPYNLFLLLRMWRTSWEGQAVIC